MATNGSPCPALCLGSLYVLRVSCNVYSRGDVEEEEEKKTSEIRDSVVHMRRPHKSYSRESFCILCCSSTRRNDLPNEASFLRLVATVNVCFRVNRVTVTQQNESQFKNIISSGDGERESEHESSEQSRTPLCQESLVTIEIIYSSQWIERRGVGKVS